MDSQHQQEEKKSFALIYILVAVFYAAMAVVYGVVVHTATEDGALDVPCILPADADPGCPAVPTMSNKTFVSAFGSLLEALPFMVQSESA